MFLVADPVKAKQIKRLDKSTRRHLDSISRYNHELNAFIQQLDTSVKSLADRSQVKLFQDYQNWLKHKDG
jgi:hypothetical protein